MSKTTKSTKLPRPLNWHILVRKKRPKEVSKGGIFLPDESQKNQAYLQHCAEVVALGPMCFTNKDTGEVWPNAPDVKPGDWLIIPQHTPLKITVEDEDYFLITDTSILASVPDPEAISVYNV